MLIGDCVVVVNMCCMFFDCYFSQFGPHYLLIDVCVVVNLSFIVVCSGCSIGLASIIVCSIGVFALRKQS